MQEQLILVVVVDLVEDQEHVMIQVQQVAQV
jgi:hypothetical protein